MKLNIAEREPHTSFFQMGPWLPPPSFPLCSIGTFPIPMVSLPSRCEMEVHLVPHPKVGLISVAPPSLLLLRTPLSIRVNKKPLTKLMVERGDGTRCSEEVLLASGLNDLGGLSHPW